MKKNLVKVAVMAMVAVFAAQVVSAQELSDKQQKKIDKIKQEAAYKNAKTEAKESKQNFKEKAKELESQGWKITGDYRTLELAMIEHQNKIDANPEKYRPYTGTVKKCRSESMGKSQARFNAQANLVAELTAKMAGEEGEVNGNNEQTGAGTTNFVQVVESTFKGNMGGVLIPSYSIVRNNSDGTMEYQTMFLIDREKEAQVAENAVEKAIKETNMTIKQATSIRNYLKESLQITNEKANENVED